MSHPPPGGWCKSMSSDIRQPLTTVGETTGSFPGRVRKGPPGKQGKIEFGLRLRFRWAGLHINLEK